MWLATSTSSPFVLYRSVCIETWLCDDCDGHTRPSAAMGMVVVWHMLWCVVCSDDGVTLPNFCSFCLQHQRCSCCLCLRWNKLAMGISVQLVPTMLEKTWPWSWTQWVWVDRPQDRPYSLSTIVAFHHKEEQEGDGLTQNWLRENNMLAMCGPARLEDAVSRVESVPPGMSVPLPACEILQHPTVLSRAKTALYSPHTPSACWFVHQVFTPVFSSMHRVLPSLCNLMLLTITCW